MKAIICCVEYDDFLTITLKRNIDLFDKVLVVTSFEDVATQDLVASYYPKCQLHITDAFYNNDALFNKGAAMEEGFDILGRDGWIAILDADIILPKDFKKYYEQLYFPFLYVPYRKMLYDPTNYHDALDWNELGDKLEYEFAGYCQIFNGYDPVLEQRPWYSDEFTHAGGCDSLFQAKWSIGRRIRPDWRVLHLGPADRNWCGRCTDRLDGKSIDNDTYRLRRKLMNTLRYEYGSKVQRII